MEFYIKKIRLWFNKHPEPKDYEFKPNKVNVVTGDSSTGKSSILRVIDYCLMARESTIVEDVINNTVNGTRIEFFRARTSDKFCVFNREEMLHIPFDLRERVSSTRFSIPGLPCLYLATTTYCCWLELRTPPDYQFNVSPVRINQKNRS